MNKRQRRSAERYMLLSRLLAKWSRNARRLAIAIDPTVNSDGPSDPTDGQVA